MAWEGQSTGVLHFWGGGYQGRRYALALAAGCACVCLQVGMMCVRACMGAYAYVCSRGVQ